MRKLYKLQDKYRAFKRFFKNVYLWYPILTSDEQWDGGYVYNVLNHKLKLMEEFFDSSKAYTSDTSHTKKIRECREVLERLIEDYYMSKEASEYYKDFDIKKINEPWSEEHSKDVARWFEEEEEARNKDKKKLFELLNDNIDGWWD